MSELAALEGGNKVDADGHELALGNSIWNRAVGDSSRDIDLIDG
jgi:hypothetical protein